MIENAEAGRNKYQVIPGKILFDFAYVGNYASAHIKASQSYLKEAATFPFKTPPALTTAGEVFFITDDKLMPS